MRMKRILSRATVAALVAVGMLASGGPASSGAAHTADYPVTTFSVLDPDWTGDSTGSITWYNRSVGIQGYVFDNAADGYNFVVYFNFFHGNTWLATQTRTAPHNGEDKRSFNFTQEGPQGGITKIMVMVCARRCSEHYPELRPSS